MSVQVARRGVQARQDGRPLVMGVLNVTPDSFSDGGRFVCVDAAVAHGRALVAAGADVLDIGGESTRPGSDPVPAEVELARVVPVVAALRAAVDVPLSIDTMKPEVARAAVAAGGDIWNDVSALRFSPDAPDVAAELGVPVILMHMLGMPKTMQRQPVYGDVVAEVAAFLRDRVGVAQAAGVASDRIWVDPGIGFGKTLAHNLALMRGLGDVIKAVGKPMLFGASRKRFIHALDPDAGDEGDRLAGSLAAALWAVQAGAGMVRVHDVRETVQALAVWGGIGGSPAGSV